MASPAARMNDALLPHGPLGCNLYRPAHRAAALSAGGFAGACGVVAGQPLDVVRIRQQAQRGAGGSGATNLARAILRAEGARALFRGMAYPLGTAALQASSMQASARQQSLGCGVSSGGSTGEQAGQGHQSKVASGATPKPNGAPCLPHIPFCLLATMGATCRTRWCFRLMAPPHASSLTPLGMSLLLPRRRPCRCRRSSGRAALPAWFRR